MKKTIIILLTAFACSTGVYAQLSATNVVPGQINLILHSPISMDVNEISSYFNIRICSDSDNYKTSYLYKFMKFLDFNDATFAEVFGTYMSGITNHVWRYESRSDTIYIHPVTNAVSMMRVGPISVSNMTARAFFDENDVLGLKKNNVKHLERKVWFGFWETEKISLEIQDAYLWEVLDEITSQLKEVYSWHIDGGTLNSGEDIILYFLEKPISPRVYEEERLKNE